MLPSKTTGASPGTAAMHLALQKLQCQGLDPPFRQRHSMLRCSAASEAGRHRNGGGGLSCSQVSIAVVPRAARLCKRGWHIQKQSAQQLQQRQREGFAVRGTLHAGGVTSADAVTESGDEVGIEREAVREPVRRLPLFDAKRDIRRSVLGFRYRILVTDGVLEVRPLTGKEVSTTTDLLTEVFATLGGAGWTVYTRYMRNQIHKFLETQLELPPDAVVLIALLHPHDDAGAEPASQPEPTSASASSRGDCQQGAVGQAVEPQQSPLQAVEDSSSAFGLTPAPAASGIASVDSAADAAASGIAAPGLPADGPSDRSEEQSGPPLTAEPVLVGTFELAFTEAARTKELTLNPPNDGAYLSNMCIAPEHRRLGYGAHMLTAAEHLTRVTAYRKIYLHNRLQDKPATALYQSVGYSIVKQDCILWGLLGQSRRYLMCKAVLPTEDVSRSEDTAAERGFG